jgi:hypothetical protein
MEAGMGNLQNPMPNLLDVSMVGKLELSQPSMCFDVTANRVGRGLMEPRWKRDSDNSRMASYFQVSTSYCADIFPRTVERVRSGQ